MRNADFLNADTHGELRKEFPPATVRTEVPVTDASRKVRRVIKHREADIKIGWLFGGCFEQTHESIGFGRKLRFRYRNKSHNSPEPANNSSANAKQGEKGL